MKIRLSLKLILLINILLFFNYSSNVVANELVIPERVELYQEVEAQLGNDVYFHVPQGNDLFQSYGRSRIVNDHFVTDDDYRFEIDQALPGQPFYLQDYNGLQQLSNTTSEDNSFIFSRVYHNLMNNTRENIEGSNLIEKYILRQYEYYGFTFEVSENRVYEPLVLDLETSSGSSSIYFYFTLINPDGSVDFHGEYIPTEADTLIPIVPNQSGTHTLVIRPYADIVIDQLALLTDFPVEKVNEGCIKTYKGSTPRIFFYEIDPTDYDSNQNGFLQLNGFIDPNIISPDYSTSSYYFGNAQIRAHSRDHQLGYDILSDPNEFHWGPTFVSVILRPPVFNEDVVTILGEGFPEEYNLEIGIFGEFTPVHQLPLNQDIIIEEYDSFFDIFVEETSVLHFEDDYLNPSYPSFIYFESIENGEIFSCSSDNCNTNGNPSSLTIIPPGEYLVQIQAPSNGARPISLVNLLTPNSLLQGGTTSINTQLDHPSLFELPSNGFECDLLNFTYTGVNSGADYKVKLFDNNGYSIGTTSDFSFNSYTNDTSSQTFTTSSLTRESANLNGGFLWLNQYSNQLLNNSEADPFSGPFLGEDVGSNIFSLQIDRIDGCSSSQLTDEEEVFQGELSTFSNQFLNVTKNSTLAYYSFTSAEGGNQIVLESQNFSISAAYVYASTGAIWTSSLSFLRIINGINHYFAILEFGTMNETDVGVYVIFDKATNGNTMNGTFSVSISESGYYTIPGYDFGRMSFTDTDNGQIPDTIERNVDTPDEFPPEIIAGVAVVAIVSLGFLGFRRMRRASV